MSKLKLFYMVSLAALAALVVFTVFRPIVADREYSEIGRVELLQAEGEWIVQFDISNHEGKDIVYTVNVSVDGQKYGDRFVVREGGKYTYIHHILRDRVGDSKVDVAIWKEGESAPLEQTTYYL